MEGHRISRRGLLSAAAGVGASAALAGCGTGTIRAAARVKAAGSDLGAVEHVVFLMHENRSFDHYFGAYRGVRGFDDHRPGHPGVFAQAWPGGQSPSLLPFHLDVASFDAECTRDLSHDWGPQHRCWHHGAMDRFAAVHVEPGVDGPVAGVGTMGYYTRADLPFWYALADAFTIGDGYHCSVMGPTHPNRLHAWSGTNDPDGLAGGPVVETSSDPERIGSATWTTMPQALQAHGVSWQVYNAPGAAYLPSSALSIAISDNILLYFRQHTADPSSPLYRNAFGSVFPADFSHDVATGALPAVSWITPPVGYDEHPPAPPAAGMWFADQVLQILVSNPAVWSRTVLFVMYDENDGFFDHVAPPTAPSGTPGEYLAVDPLPAPAEGIRGPMGLGFRVPLLVVSPFARGGYVVSDTFDHTSQLRFLETRFGVPVPNLTAWRRRVTGDLTSTLSVLDSDTSVPALPATDPRSALVDAQCTGGQLVGVDVVDPPAYPISPDQVMPAQEPGTARRR